MKIIWDSEAWTDYVAWQGEDKKTVKRINALIKDIMSNGALKGKGKPEHLKYELSDWYSRRIDETNRLVYRIKDESLIIVQRKEHY